MRHLIVKKEQDSSVRPFKFFEPYTSQPKVFNLNVMEDLGRIPSYNVYIEPYELEHTMECTGSIRNFISGVVQLPTHVLNGVLLKRVDGEYTEINYNNVDGVNQRGLIFDMNDSITFRYRV
jgi:hypothetical protein